MKSHPLVLATRNAGKIEEFRRILDEIAPGQVELIGLEKFPHLGDVEETGKTFEENSLLKARTICLATGISAIADDSGLCVDFLGGILEFTLHAGQELMVMTKLMCKKYLHSCMACQVKNEAHISFA